ncbi:MAG TPA: VWA domain-containing protein, partial [Streptosporangiaceae bacterium]|nr:VWA domain-containing protein [Streptosporangiaceae bacterium]
MPAAPELERVPFTGLLVAFAGELRAAGLAVGSGDVLQYCSALSRLNPADLVDLYWAGRATLVNRHDDIAVYDRVFRRFFLAADDEASDPLTLMLRASAEAQGALAIPSTEPGESEPEDDAILGWMASDVEALKHKSFTACTPEELAALRRIMARIKLTPPRRRTRRNTPARTGPRPDPRRMVRETLRMHGEPARLYWRRRKVRLRPLILILDVSGSMADYSRSLLQF